MDPETEHVAGRTRLRGPSQSYVGLMLIIIPLFVWFSSFILMGDTPLFLTTALLVIMITGLSLILMQYLQTGLAVFRPAKLSFALKEERQTLSMQVEEALTSFRKELTDLQTRELRLDESDLAAARERLKSTLEDTAAQEVLARIEEKVASKTKQTIIASELESALHWTLERLGTEVAALGRRGNLNLVLGIVTTIVGLVVLGYAVFAATGLTQDPALIASYYLPRLSLVVLIEIFAYFFLNLYKSNLAEIKYFQNETTNVEAKYTALGFALMLKDAKTLSIILTTLAATERNFTLKKGETTVELERSKLDSKSLTTFSKSLSGLLDRSNKDSKP